MTNTAEQIDFEEVPSGGIGDFVMSDDDFATLEKQNSRQEFGDNGIAEFEDIASRMASYGRFGDDRVVHVETGELIVPRKLIDQSPALKESIFQHLREAGIEDPERYVVGSAENSFNPETGLMEFGFFSKIFKGIKKAVKKIGKVLKKAAPIILSIGLAMTPLGPIYGAALGSGIGTLIQGGNLKDAFKAAAMAGATAGLLKGAQGAFTEGQTFMGNVGDALSNPVARLSQTGTAFTDAFTGAGKEGFFDTLTQDFVAPPIEAVADPAKALTEAVADPTKALANTGAVNTPATVSAAEQQLYVDNNLTNQQILDYQSSPSSEAFTGTIKSAGPAIADTTLTAAGDAGAKSSYFDTFKDYMVRGGDSQLTIDVAKSTAQKTAIQNYLAEATINGGKEYAASAAVQAGAKAAGESAFKAAGTSLLAKYGPSALALTGIGAAGGFFDVPQQEQVGIVPRDLQGNMITGADLIDANPEKYQIFSDGNFSRNYIPDYSQTLVASTNPGTVYGETGGQVFPRRNGGIMMDEGVPNEDSVRAMLMPGEFVMTTDAVRGAGNGNVDQGIKNMYEVMRGLERRGGAMS